MFVGCEWCYPESDLLFERNGKDFLRVTFDQGRQDWGNEFVENVSILVKFWRQNESRMGRTGSINIKDL